MKAERHRTTRGERELWLYLDLEDTVIESWYERRLIYPRGLSKAARAIGASHLGIFSYAIAHPHEVEDYQRNIDPLIASLCGQGASRVVSLEEMMETALKMRGVRFQDMIDDVVEDMSVVQREQGNEIAFVNVRHLAAERLPQWIPRRVVAPEPEPSFP
jgi:hypothetical protein